MDRLGYDRYGAQGGDWGSAVTTSLGAQDAAHCAGIHLTLAMATRPQVDGEPTREEARALDGIQYYSTGIPAIPNSNRPGRRRWDMAWRIRLSGQAAWILEKFWAWTDCDGHPENVLGRDELLDNVMLYWVPASGASSARLYWESFGPKRRIGAHGRHTDRRRRISQGNRPARAQVDGEQFHRHPSLERNAQGRSLRCLRAA